MTPKCEFGNCRLILSLSRLLNILSLEFTESVFRRESGHGELKTSRRTLCQTLNLRPLVNVRALQNLNTAEQQHQQQQQQQQPQQLAQASLAVEKPVPLLYYLVNALKEHPNLLSFQPEQATGICNFSTT